MINAFKPSRCFIAWSLSDTTAQAVASRQYHCMEQRYSGNIRFVPPENFHITTLFLGNLHNHQIKQVARLLEDRRQAWSFPRKINLYPPADISGGSHPPRVLVVPVEDPSRIINRQRRELEEDMSLNGLPADNLEFHPHITLGYVKKKSDSHELRIFFQDVGHIKTAPVLEASVTGIHLYKSETGKGPSRYHIIA